MYTTGSFSEIYLQIIKNKDKSFYNNNPELKNITKPKERANSNFRFVIIKYTQNYSEIINNYLKTGNFIQYTREEIESFIYCLHSLLVLK